MQDRANLISSAEVFMYPEVCHNTCKRINFGRDFIRNPISVNKCVSSGSKLNYRVRLIHMRIGDLKYTILSQSITVSLQII